MEDKDKILIGLRKASSLLQKVNKMVEENHYCIDVMQQNLAVIGLLRSVHQQLMQRHLKTCFATAIESKDLKKKITMADEILQVTNLYNR